MTVIYPYGMVSVSSLGFFCLLVHLLNLLIIPFLSLSEYTIFEIISRRIEGGAKIHTATGGEGQA